VSFSITGGSLNKTSDSHSGSDFDLELLEIAPKSKPGTSFFLESVVTLGRDIARIFNNI